jgi:integrase/recombinase XerD
MYGSKRDAAIFHVAYFLGLRASEVGLLVLDDYNDVAGQIYVTRLKGSISRAKRLDDKRKKMVRRYLKTRHDLQDPYVPLFLSRQGGKGVGRKMLHLLIRKYGKMARISEDRRHFHVLRHSIGIHTAEAGFDLKESQWVLDHKSITNTQIYHTFTTRQQDTFYAKMKTRVGYFS